jgi:hypothetical protein
MEQPYVPPSQPTRSHRGQLGGMGQLAWNLTAAAAVLLLLHGGGPSHDGGSSKLVEPENIGAQK